MKLKTTCLALSCSMFLPFTAAQADDTDFSFYGSLRVMVEAAKHDNGDNFKDAASRIGVSGSHNLGEGLTAFAKYEVKVDVAEGELGSDTGSDARVAKLGLSGDFGTLQVGKMWSAFYNAVGYAPDQLWWNTAPVYYSLDGNFRIEKSVMYTSPEMSGFQVSALYSDDTEESQFTASYKVSDSLKLTAGFIDDQNNDSVGVAAYYSGDGYYVNGMYMDKDDVGKGADIMSGISSGKSLYSFGVSSFEDQSGGTNDFDAVILAYQYNIHPKVKLWVEAWAWDGVLYGNEDSNSINFGMNYDF